jgi:hypothetical protein
MRVRNPLENVSEASVRDNIEPWQPFLPAKKFRFANAEQGTDGWLSLGSVSVSACPGCPTATATSTPTGPTATATRTPTQPPASSTPTRTATPTATNPPGFAVYEAEAAGNTLAGGALVAACASCSGGQKVGYVGNGGTLQFNGVSAGTAGSYALTIAYLNGAATRSAQLRVNGGSPVTLNFPGTGSWDTVGTINTTISLNAGSNTIQLSNPSGWAPDFDRITLNAGGPTSTPTRTPTRTPTPTNGPTSTPTRTPTRTPTPTNTPTSAPSSGLIVDNFDGTPAYPSATQNDLGKWTGANGFTNGSGSGAVSSGALTLQYSNAGWFGSDVYTDVSNKTYLVLRVRGNNGGEQAHFQMSIGGVTRVFNQFLLDGGAQPSITTSYQDIKIPLVANGISRSSPGQLSLGFWYGGSGIVSIDEIRFE